MSRCGRRRSFTPTTRSYKLTGQAAADDYLEAWRVILDEASRNTLVPNALRWSQRSRSPRAYRRSLPERCRCGSVSSIPGSTNLGRPDDERACPSASCTRNSYDDIRTSFAFCEQHELGPSLAIYEPGFHADDARVLQGGEAAPKARW